tara:strand:+ start:206 stop:634 length:429 start_codon:yes stop_codon:yes gene_type:complete
MKLLMISFLLANLAINPTYFEKSQAFEKINFEKDITNKQLAEKYCDSLRKNIFKGLDKESKLKYEYFFSSIPENSIKDIKNFLITFKSNVKYVCSYELTKSDDNEFKSFLEYYFKTRSNTPKIIVDAKKPTPINPATIPVFR